MFRKSIIKAISTVMVWVMCFTQLSYGAGSGWVKDAKGWKHFTLEQADTGGTVRDVIHGTIWGKMEHFIPAGIMMRLQSADII